MTKNEILDMIDATITSNGKGEISGKVLNLTLRTIVNYIDEKAVSVPEDAPENVTPEVPEDNTSTDQTKPESLIGTWSQKWDVGAGESMGPDNWGSATVISPVSTDPSTSNYRPGYTEGYIASPIFGSMGYSEGGILQKLEDGRYKLTAGTHNLLGPVGELYFHTEDTLYIPEYNLSVPAEILALEPNAENGMTKLNDWSYVTNYKLTKN